ncbi:MAG TPA: hypothetical protein VK427_19025 [Kofleriaceae bacterium]|nr:hypothetical protein [Kofleriaceae bacterium]
MEALAARHAALEAEVAERARARDEVARMLAEAQAREQPERFVRYRCAGGVSHRRRMVVVIASMMFVMVGIFAIGFAQGAREDAAREARVSSMLHTMQGFTNAACACVEKTCAARVSARFTAWSSGAGAVDGLALQKEQLRRMTELSDELGRCLAAGLAH